MKISFLPEEKTLELQLETQENFCKFLMYYRFFNYYRILKFVYKPWQIKCAPCDGVS